LVRIGSGTGASSRERSFGVKGKVMLVIGGAVGYVLGTRDGRERFEQMKSATEKLWHDKRVQDTANKAQHLAKDKLPGHEGHG
jgi:hypothetical protein